MKANLNRAAWCGAVVVACAVVGGGGVAEGAINRIDSTPARISTNFTVANIGGVPSVVFVQPGLAGGPDQILALPASGGTPLTVMGQNFSRRVSGPLATDGSSIYFNEVRSETIEGGVFEVSPGAPSGQTLVRKIMAGTFTGGPGSVSAARGTGGTGKVAFRGLTVTGQAEELARFSSESDPITVFGAEFAPVGRPGISADGSVATLGTSRGDATSPPGPALLVRPGGGGTVITIRGENFAPTGGSRVFFAGGEFDPVIVSTTKDTATGPKPMIAMAARTGYAAYQAIALEISGSISVPSGAPAGSGDDGLFQLGRGSTLPPRTNHPGTVNITARYAGGSVLSLISISTPPLDAAPPSGTDPLDPAGYTEVPLLKFGDVVGTSTIARIDIAEDGFLDDYNVVVHLTLADGNTGFYIYSIPEPASMALLAPAFVLLRRRR